MASIDPAGATASDPPATPAPGERRNTKPAIVPKPFAVRRWLAVGITGHRPERLGLDRLEAVALAIGEVLAAIETAAQAHGAERLRLVGALAEGVDSIAADVALSRGWSLDAILPFHREDYLGDFTDETARTAHEVHLAKAHAVFELPGGTSETLRPIAYERAGHVMLDQSDLLVAVWDGEAARGRGGAAQIVADAVRRDIPVLWIDPAATHPCRLLWDGLVEHDLGQQTIETVPRGSLDDIPALIGRLLDPPGEPHERRTIDHFGRERLPRSGIGLAYPMLLALAGVRRLRLSDLRPPRGNVLPDALLKSCAGSAARANAFGEQLHAIVAPRFARADAIATRAAQLFRSGYVANFGLAAAAVLLSLAGLALPIQFKPILVVLEVVATATILLLTRTAHRGRWHRRWLDNRELAERLRCLAVSAQVGELGLRVNADSGSGWIARATARELAVPSVAVDHDYLRCVQSGLFTLIDDQIGYLDADRHRMHRLEHRLHLFGGLLFGLTALTCVVFLCVEALMRETLETHAAAAHLLGVTGVMASAALPAIGAAIYGIRMQGDFAGIAERNHLLAHHLRSLRDVCSQDEPSFDTLRARVARATDLLTEGLENWRQTYRSRPLVLPG